MDDQEWLRAHLPEDLSITFLYSNNKEVRKHNHRMLKALGTPIVLVEAEHSCEAARAASSSDMMGLERRCYLADGAKVALPSNVGIYAGLCTGTEGVVKWLVYEEGRRPPGLPKFVLVDFGGSYCGESFFPGMPERAGWVPVYPFTAHSITNPTLSRRMPELKLAFAWSFWKAQGHTDRGRVAPSS